MRDITDRLIASWLIRIVQPLASGWFIWSFANPTEVPLSADRILIIDMGESDRLVDSSDGHPVIQRKRAILTLDASESCVREATSLSESILAALSDTSVISDSIVRACYPTRMPTEWTEARGVNINITAELDVCRAVEEEEGQ